MFDIITQIVQKHIAAQPAFSDSLPVAAVTSWSGRNSERHAVYVIPDPYNQGGGPVVVIDDTPGRWYVKDFLHGSGRISIDYGAGYWLDNADEVREAVRQYLNSNKPADRPDPQRLEGVTRDFVRGWEHAIGATNLRPKLRYVLEEASPFVASLFGEQDGKAFDVAIKKLRSVSASDHVASMGSDKLSVAEQHLVQAMQALNAAADVAHAARGTYALFDDRIETQLRDMLVRVENVQLEVRPLLRTFHKYKLGGDRSV